MGMQHLLEDVYYRKNNDLGCFFLSTRVSRTLPGKPHNASDIRSYELQMACRIIE